MANRAILLGNLGHDPQLRYLESGVAVANFSVATSEKWKDRDTGEAKKKTEWHKVVAFGGLAEICGEWLKKGKKVFQF